MTFLHFVGDRLRDLFGLMPLPVVRILFLALPIALLVWVLFLPNKAATPPDRPARWDENLKIWAAVALLMQIAIYLFL